MLVVCVSVPIAREEPPSSLLPVDPRLGLGEGLNVELLLSQGDAEGLLLLFVIEGDTEGVGEEVVVILLLLNSPGDADKRGLINGLAEGVCQGDNTGVDGDGVGLAEELKGLLDCGRPLGRGLLEGETVKAGGDGLLELLEGRWPKELGEGLGV